MRGAALNWWNFLQHERVENKKNPITSWKKMEVEVRNKFVPKGFEVTLHQKLQNLKQKDLDVSTYIEEFHKLSLRSSLVETES